MIELLRNIERFETARDELRDMVREAHAAAKDLRLACREAEARKQAVKAGVGERLEAEVASQLAVLGEQTRKAMDESVQKVIDEFETLTNLIMTGNNNGRGSDLRASIADIAAAEARGAVGGGRGEAPGQGGPPRASSKPAVKAGRKDKPAPAPHQQHRNPLDAT